MGNQRFKVGDWVRSLVNWGDIEVGKVYQIPHLDGDGEPWFTPDGTGGWSDYLTLDEIEPWQPLVGERVRVNYPGWEGEGDVTAEYAHGITLVTLRSGKCSGEEGGFVLRDIEPITTATAPEQPAALKIEAGKFYKTRDGRKAKVERARYGDSYDFVATFEGWSGEKVYKKDGKHGSRWIANNPSNDLVAEWIDEPVAKAKPSNDNANPKFKVGDRVKCMKSYPGQFTAGKEYVVSADHFGRKYESVKVNFDDAGSTKNGWLPEFFELVTPTTIIVALIENGQPKPSSMPRVHASTGAAEKEAKRLAAKYKGQQFGVFTLAATHEEAAPVYDHKWQNMAALGLKIDAIKELRAIAGIDLLTAKRAVEAFENAA
ncbi:hypothetical protein [Agrobacterium pusense]|uniref:hypothetical protein n=1 Tax=Agrobacterium pusense TaxID=648995 RepID=UPI002FDEBE4B